MDLTSLLFALPRYRLLGDPDVSVSGITCDSRRVQPGSLFVAYRGVNVDVHDFVVAAVEHGAVVVAGVNPWNESQDKETTDGE